MLEPSQNCLGRPSSITMSRSMNPHQAGPPKDPTYRDPPAFLDDTPQEVLTQGLSLAVTETETRMEAMSTDALTLQMSRVKRKKHIEPPGSESSEETSDILTDTKEIRDQLLERIDSVVGAIDSLAKFMEAKFKSLETKDKLQTDVSFMYSRTVQGTPPTGRRYPSLPDVSNPPLAVTIPFVSPSHAQSEPLDIWDDW